MADNNDAERLENRLENGHRQLYAFRPSYRKTVDALRELGEFQFGPEDSLETVARNVYRSAYIHARKDFLKGTVSALIAYGATQFDYSFVDETVAVAALIYTARKAFTSFMNFSAGRGIQKQLNLIQNIIKSKR